MSSVNPESIRENPGLSRRERQHRATKVDLVSAARAVLIREGLDAVTVRAVAARVGLSGPAMYRYYDSREALLEDVVDALYEELADHLESVSEPDADPVGSAAVLTERLFATSRAFRRWALDHTAEFGLLFGAPIPGVGQRASGPAGDQSSDRGMRFMSVWLRLFQEIVATNLEVAPWPEPIAPELHADIDRFLERIGGAIPAPLALLFLTCWTDLYGFISTEVFGHLRFALDDGTHLFEARLGEFRSRLSLP